MADDDDPVVRDTIDRAGAQLRYRLMDRERVRWNRHLRTEWMCALADADPIEVEGREAGARRRTHVRLRIRLVGEVPVRLAIGGARHQDLYRAAQRVDDRGWVTHLAVQMCGLRASVSERHRHLNRAAFRSLAARLHGRRRYLVSGHAER